MNDLLSRVTFDVDMNLSEDVVARGYSRGVHVGWRRAAAQPMAPASDPGYDRQVNDLLARVTFDPTVMGGRPCLRGLRVTVSTVVGLVAAGRTTAEILAAYPYLEADDVRAALAWAAWRAGEIEVPLPA